MIEPYGWTRCAARPAIRRRTRASGQGTDQLCSCPHLLLQIEAWCANCPEPLICVMQQVLGDGDVDQSRVDIPMTEIGREERQAILRVDARPVPFEDPVHDHRVAQVMNARAGFSSQWLQLESAEF